MAEEDQESREKSKTSRSNTYSIYAGGDAPDLVARRLGLSQTSTSKPQ